MQGYREMNRAPRQELSFQTDFLRFQLDRLKRGRKSKSLRRSIEPHDAVLRQLREDEFAVLRGRADKGLSLELRREMEAHLDSGKHLTGVSKDSARVAGDLGGAAGRRRRLAPGGDRRQPPRADEARGRGAVREFCDLLLAHLRRPAGT